MSDSLVIVALPRASNEVNKVSSEKAAHVTLLFLGENTDLTSDVVQYVEHAVATSFEPIYLEVSDRRKLGPDEADVLVFAGEGARKLEEFRSLLLKDASIRKLYDENDQYPQFTPHLTLGYPATPANEPEHDWMLNAVEVDRIAVWTGDSDGPEFKPPFKDYSMTNDVGWADTKTLEKGEEVLAHYGVKGMKWGVRKAQANAGVAVATPSVTPKGKAKIAVSKGGSQKPTDDAVKVAVIKQTYKKSGPNALTNKQLQDLQTRLNLEKSVSQLTTKPDGKVKKFIKNKLGMTMHRTTDTIIQQQVAGALNKK